LHQLEDRSSDGAIRARDVDELAVDQPMRTDVDLWILGATSAIDARRRSVNS
jgi:hypothetical protein